MVKTHSAVTHFVALFWPLLQLKVAEPAKHRFPRYCGVFRDIGHEYRAL